MSVAISPKPSQTPRRWVWALVVVLLAAALAVAAVWMLNLRGETAVSDVLPQAPASAQTVERGQYLARVGNCMSCHTAKGGAAYAGGSTAGVLVNVSRGMLVDEDALLQALRQRTLAGAALDVFDREPPDAAKWRDLDNVVLSPHLAGYTREAGVAMFGQLRENLRRHFAGEPLLTPEPPACRNS